MTPENKPDYTKNPNDHAKNSNDPTKNPSARDLEASIGETRAGMSDDIKALGDKASPANVKQEIKQVLKSGKDAAVEQAIDTARDVKETAVEVKNVVVDKAVEVKDTVVETAQKAAETVSETVDEVSYQTRRAGRAAWEFAQANAVPLSLLGLGAAWLVSNRRKESTRSLAWRAEADYYDGPEYYDQQELEDDALYASNGAYPAGGRSPIVAPTPIPTPSARRAPRVRARQRNVKPTERERTAHAEHDGGAIREVGASISRGSHTAYDKVSDTLGRAQHSLADGVTRSRDFVKDKYLVARDASLDFADANPVALALGTLAAGIGIGLLIPGTKREDALFGPSRERMRTAIGSANEAAQDVRRLAKQTARETMASVEGMSR